MTNFSIFEFDRCLNNTKVTHEGYYWMASGNTSITAVAVCQLIVSVTGTIWNTMVLAVVLKKKLFKDPTYILLMNLLVADLLLCALVLPFNTESSFSREFSLGQSDYVRCQSCQAIPALLVTFIVNSFLTLPLLALDRLFYITWPFKYRHYVLRKHVLLLIVFIWILSIVLALLPVLGFGLYRFTLLGVCSPMFFVMDKSFSNDKMYLFIILLVLILPFLISSVVNISIVCFACKYARQSRLGGSRNAELGNSTAEARSISPILNKKLHLAKVSGAVFIIDVILWFPFIAVPAVLISTETPLPAFAVAYLSVVIQPAVHSVLETCILGKAAKEIYKSLCCCVKMRKEGRIC